jgi:hypothetical protein
MVEGGTPGPTGLLSALVRALTIALVALAVCGGQAHAGTRIAMVLAAEKYTNFERSEVGAKRGEEIAELLRTRGFEVIVVTNPANATARAALRDFAAKVATADLAVALLIGHGVSSGGQTFFIPSNAAIDRSTDLLSRGISVTNIAQIAARGRTGGVCFLMTTPNFAKPIDGVDVKPQFRNEIAKNVAAAFSNSAKIPISRMDAAAGLAASDVVGLLQKQPHADLRQLINACASQQQGTLYGLPAAVDLAMPAKIASTEAVETKRETRLAAVPPPVSTDGHSALETLERLLDPRQVRRIQTRLAQMGLYQGPIDAIVGVLTRSAIKDYQRKQGVAETGYLTPEQLEALTAGPP